MKQINNNLAKAFVLALCAISLSTATRAADFTWDANGATAGVGGTGNWTGGNTWRTNGDTGGLGPWSDGSTARFSASSTITLNGNVLTTASTNAGGSATIQIVGSGGNTIDFGAGGFIVSGGNSGNLRSSANLKGAVTLVATSGTLANTAAIWLKANNTTLTSVTCSGISGGTMVIDDAGALGPAASSSLMITNGIVLNLGALTSETIGATPGGNTGISVNAVPTTLGGGYIRARTGACTWNGPISLTANGSGFITRALTGVSLTLASTATVNLNTNTLGLNVDSASSGVTINSVISGTGGISTVTVTSGANGAGITTLGAANTFSGRALVSQNLGTLALNNVNALQNATLDTGLTGSQSVTFIVAGNNTYNLGALQGTNNLAIGGNTISVGTKAVDTTFGGGISGNGGSLTKVGNNKLTITGVSSYTGPTVVNGGKLALPLPQGSSGLTLANGTTFNATTTNSPWYMASAAITNATMGFNYGSWTINGYTNAVYYVTNLAASGSITCNISGTSFPVTNLTLLTYGAKTGGGSFVLNSNTLPAGMAATLLDTGSSIELQISSASIQNLVWSGGDGNWQTNGGLNWNNGTATYLEYPSGLNDLVTFNDGSSGTVNINSQVNPSSTTVSISASGFYTFQGPGSIGGTNGIAFTSGGGTLTINNSNNFTGPVSISGVGGSAVLYVGNSYALGATTGNVTVNSPTNTLSIGVPGGSGIAVNNKTVIINGAGLGGNKGALRGAQVASGENIWAGPVIIGSNNSRIGADNNGNLTVSGNITDNGAGYAITFRPGQNATVTVSGTGNSWGGTTTLFGDSGGGSLVKLGANNAFPVTNGLAVGNCTFDLSGFNQSAPSLSFSTGGTAPTILTDSGPPATLTVNATNGTSSFPGDVTGSLSLTKNGSNTMTLNGVNLTYTGATTVNQGQLNLWGTATMASSIVVNGGAALAMTNSTTGALTLSANSTLSLAAGTPITVGSLVASTAPVNISFTVAPSLGSDILLVTSTSPITGSAANFQVSGARSGIFYITNSNTELHYVVPATAALVTWKGNDSFNPTIWDITTTTNWSYAANPSVFYTGDVAVFEDTAASGAVVIKTGGVAPGGVIFSNNSLSYTLSGAAINGSTALVKSGAGAVYLNSANNYTGGTFVSNGVVFFAADASFGPTNAVATTSIVLDGGGIALTGANLNLNANRGIAVGSSGGSISNAVVGAGNLGYSGIITGSGILTIGSADFAGVILNGQNTYSGGSVLMGSSSATIYSMANSIGTPGSLVSGTFGTGPITFNGTAMRSTVSFDTTIGNNIIFAADATFPTLANEKSLTFTGPVTITNSSRTLTVNIGTTVAGKSLTFAGVVGDSGKGYGLTKAGTGLLILSETNTYTGNTTVSGGTLELAVASLATNSTVTVASGAKLQLDFSGVTNRIAALVLNGVSQAAGVYDSTSGAPFITGTGALHVVVSAPPTMTFTNTGGNLQITFTGGTLQAQTNSLSTGLGTNWVDYTGSSPVTVPINPSNPSVFFRVKQ